MSAQEEASGSPPEPSAAQPAGEPSWIDRLKAVIGLRTNSLRTDLAEVLAKSEVGKAEFTPAERTMLRNILDLEQRRIGDVMVPRADIIAVQKNITIGDLLKVFAGAAHSRLVVYDDTLDDPVGMVHIRDVVSHLTRRAAVGPERPRGKRPLPSDLDLRAADLSEPLSATSLIRPILFVPRSMPAIDLLVKMQASRIHLALVIDEYGGTDGLVSIEDIVEEVVGDIEDEHDQESDLIVQQPDGSFIADARLNLDEAAEKIGPAFAAGEAVEEVDTLGGLLVMLAGRVPVRGEILEGPDNFEIEVLDADPRRVKRLRVYRRPPDLPRREPRRRIAEEGPTVAPALPQVPDPAAKAARSADDPSN